ncbi:MAG: HAD family phosphatase [Clostridia bacterium]|nr:HAD family phosphatase [Clostridia bacterium]
MKNFEGLLLVTDLDGTLLRHDKSISKENLEAIEYFKANGGKFTFITGRLPVGSKRIYNMVRPNAPIGCINGGGIFDWEKEQMLWHMALCDEALFLAEYVDKNMPTMGIELNAFDKIYFCKKNRAVEQHRKNENFEDIICHYTEVDEPVSKILFADESEEIDKLVELLAKYAESEMYDFIRSDPKYYEVLPKGSSKGNLVAKIAQMVDIDIKNTIAVGDNDNDVSMLKIAGRGYAVSNASDNAKAAADFITVSNEEHAIAKVIEECLA